MTYTVNKQIGILALLGFLITIATLIFNSGAFYFQVKDNTKIINEQKENVASVFNEIESDVKEIRISQQQSNENLVYFMGQMNIQPLHTFTTQIVPVARRIPIYEENVFLAE